MCCNSAKEIRLRVEVVCVPNSFRKGTGPDPNLHVMSVPVVDLAPQADFSPHDVFLVLVVLNATGNILVVQIKPGNVASIPDSEVVPHAHIEIKRSVVRNHHLLIGMWVSPAPPMDNVSLFDFDVRVHPVHRSLFGIKLLDNLMLLPSVVSLDLLLFDVLELDKFRLV